MIKPFIACITEDEGLLAWLADALAFEGYPMLLNTDAERTLNLLSVTSERFVVLLDLTTEATRAGEFFSRIKATLPMHHVIGLCGKRELPRSSDELIQGVDDYLIKPIRTLDLLNKLVGISQKFEQEFSNLPSAPERPDKILPLRPSEALVPICMTCKKVRENDNKWIPLETFVSSRSPIKFTHGVCPECAKAMLKEKGLPAADK